jgi:phage baseplate assembly protein W
MVTELDRDIARRRALGWSLECPEILPGIDLGRDLRIQNGDFTRVQAIDCLDQSLTLALTTALGTDIFNTSFGFDGINALVDETNPVMMRERVRVSVIQVLRKDPRVRRIVDVKLQDGQLELLPPGSRELSVSVTFEAVTGDQVSVDLGKVAINA